MKLSKVFLFAMSLGMMLCFGASTHAQVLFGATGSNGVNGQLVTINTLTGSATVVAPLLDASSNAYGMTGLAFNPATGVLFGATGNSSPTAPANLVTINPTTGLVTPIGPFSIGSPIADLSFDRTTGIFYGVTAVGGVLVTINPATGVATNVGAGPGISGFSAGHGTAINSSSAIFTVPNAADLYTYNNVTGAGTLVAALTGSPATPFINAMDFNAANTLFGIVSTNLAGVSTTNLVTINTTTGAITNIGASLNDLDGLAFQIVAVPEPATIALIGIGAVGLGSYYWRQRRRHQQLSNSIIS